MSLRWVGSQLRLSMMLESRLACSKLWSYALWTSLDRTMKINFRASRIGSIREGTPPGLVAAAATAVRKEKPDIFILSITDRCRV